MKRYAIKLPDGSYSNGPQMRSVAFEKAKLWTNKGHVLLHIQGLPQAYPPGTQIVEVEFRHTEQPVMLVSDYMTDYEHRKSKAKAESHQRWLLSHKEYLERELQDIKAKIGK